MLKLRVPLRNSDIKKNKDNNNNNNNNNNNKLSIKGEFASPSDNSTNYFELRKGKNKDLLLTNDKIDKIISRWINLFIYNEENEKNKENKKGEYVWMKIISGYYSHGMVKFKSFLGLLYIFEFFLCQFDSLTV